MCECSNYIKKSLISYNMLKVYENLDLYSHENSFNCRQSFEIFSLKYLPMLVACDL